MTDTRVTAPRYQGIVPPLVTPLSGPDALDPEGLERLIEHLIRGGVTGLFMLGTTGEAPSLSYHLRRELIEKSARIAAGRVPVLAGITDTSFVESVALARHAADHGADAVVVAPPYYLPPGQPELLEYLEDLIAQLPLPCMLYNMPPLTKVQIGVEIVERLIDNPGVIGLKDSSGDLSYFHYIENLGHTRANWSVMMGPELLMADSVFAGGDGGVAGGANVFPAFYTEVYRAAAAGDVQAVRKLQETVIHIQKLYTVGKHASSGIKGIKCALSLFGVCGPALSEPFREFREPERRQIEAIVAGLQEDPALQADYVSLSTARTPAP